jgi:uncharacterized protein YndB with AHSA1/START domain
MTDELATFDDTRTMRYQRFYPHPIDDVWDAVTDAEQLDIWFAPACGVVVERRVGGRCAFAYGSAMAKAYEGTVTQYEPPNVVHYQLEGSSMRFELEAVDGGTRLDFIHAFDLGVVDPDIDPAELPAGPGTPWHPGFCAGFHEMLDQLGGMLGGTWTLADAEPFIDAVATGGDVHALMEYQPAEVRRHHEALEARYRVHIAANCPR